VRFFLGLLEINRSSSEDISAREKPKPRQS